MIIKFHLNDQFSRTGLTFDFEILPTTVFNRKDLQGAYFSGAQYGYSKMFAGVAMGIKQMDQLSLMNFESSQPHVLDYEEYKNINVLIHFSIHHKYTYELR